MKKFIKIIFIAGAIFMLAACSNNSQEIPANTDVTIEVPTEEEAEEENEEMPDDEQQEELNIQIDLATDEFLSTFAFIHEIDYTDVREVRDGGGVENFNGDRLVIWANAPVSDFSLIAMRNDFVNEEVIFIPSQAFGTINELSVGQAFVVNSYVGLGTLPWSGITFLDENGYRHYYAIIQGQMDGSYSLMPFEPRVDDFPSMAEEFGNTIVAAGNFWEDWWNLSGRFSWDYIESIPWEEWGDLPDGIGERGFGSRLLPSSGFTSIRDIYNYLSKYYTENWLDEHLFGEFSMFAVFAEHDGVLYIHDARAGFPRPNWETATHVLIHQDDNYATIETTVLHGSWHREESGGSAYPTPVTHIFTFINGRIDSVVEISVTTTENR
ncbi:MAG: IseA DL-endopeptidase inhibitor family protein, partial [Defluviitaleaceae bacterium]|nr:IseA DL-endopeptidase inhibitor family protein [Defluviitaleaceae bacterium]